MIQSIQLRPERPEDIETICLLTQEAFRDAAHSSGTEAAIVDALRAASALTVSLVADDAGEIIGHVAFSPVSIDSHSAGWYGLGPVSVRPDRQRQGIGQALIQQGFLHLRGLGAQGCVVLGNPGYYSRFGFVSDPQLHYADVPPEYFQRIVFQGAPPRGEVTYHAAFGAS
jgi:predicted N-acetyltransferase YhbS